MYIALSYDILRKDLNTNMIRPNSYENSEFPAQRIEKVQFTYTCNTCTWRF